MWFQFGRDAGRYPHWALIFLPGNVHYITTHCITQHFNTGIFYCTTITTCSVFAPWFASEWLKMFLTCLSEITRKKKKGENQQKLSNRVTTKKHQPDQLGLEPTAQLVQVWLIRQLTPLRFILFENFSSDNSNLGWP